MRIAANVAAATHGESTAEPLGSGNAGQALQRFPLREVAAHARLRRRAARPALDARAAGSTGCRWNEVDLLFGHGPDERVYTVRIDEDANADVQFGDGRTGARLPTGPENMRAAYRTGLGRDGNLDRRRADAAHGPAARGPGRHESDRRRPAAPTRRRWSTRARTRR